MSTGRKKFLIDRNSVIAQPEFVSPKLSKGQMIHHP